MLQTKELRALEAALGVLAQANPGLPESVPAVALPGLERVLRETAERMQDNFPYAHPLYAGQMLKPPHPVARLAYMLALYVNPNNHALDGGRASSALEREAVAQIAAMLGYERHLGHLCASGTIANLEALWVARQECTGLVLASSQAHYTHARMCELLQIPFEGVGVDAAARMDLNALEDRLRRGKVATVVATLGTTATGSVDPLPQILALRERYGFRLHVDAAYGGYFRLAGNLAAPARAAFDVLGAADSIVVDPHKHGLQPYGCGCVLFRDPAVGRHYRHDSPYTYFSSDDLHLGEISLECSRPGAAAVALWATQRLLPLERGGAFAAGLEQGRAAALALHHSRAADARSLAGPEPELDIAVWTCAADTHAQAGARARALFEAAARRDLHLALFQVPQFLARAWWPGLAGEEATTTALRSCLMKPEHQAWLPRILEILDAAGAQIDGAH